MAEKEATFIRKLRKWRGDARLYKLNPPIPNIEIWAWNASDDQEDYEYLIISRVSVYEMLGGTNLYLSNRKAEVEDEREPFKSGCSGDNETILRKLGYELVKAPKVKVAKNAEQVVRAVRLED